MSVLAWNENLTIFIRLSVLASTFLYFFMLFFLLNCCFSFAEVFRDTFPWIRSEFSLGLGNTDAIILFIWCIHIQFACCKQHVRLSKNIFLLVGLRFFLPLFFVRLICQSTTNTDRTTCNNCRTYNKTNEKLKKKEEKKKHQETDSFCVDSCACYVVLVHPNTWNVEHRHAIASPTRHVCVCVCAV